MCNHVHLQERYIEEHVAEMRHDAYLQQLMARLPRQHSGVMRHGVSRLGTGLVVLGRWLEHFEQRERQVTSPATYK